MLPATQGRSSRIYDWVIMFMWNINEEDPFSIVPIRHFKGGNDFPIELVTGALTDKSRIKRYKINCLPGNNNYSLFCKIEKGKIFYIY